VEVGALPGVFDSAREDHAVIERLRTSLRTLATLSPAELVSPSRERLRADCADALRLELDCPQQSLAPSQRAELSHLSELLDGSSARSDALASAVQRAWRTIS
jgi:hypothetical protein